MGNVVKIYGLFCEECGVSNTYEQNDSRPTIYECTHIDSDNQRCLGRVFKCNKCDKIYQRNGFGLRGNVYECKTCGASQWDLTETWLTWRTLVIKRKNPLP